MSNKIPLIKQNKNQFFKFIYNKEKKYIDIEYDHKTKINYTNLFLILKSYLIEEHLLIENIFINSSEIENHNYEVFNINLFHNIKINKLKKINIFEFKDWLDEMKEADYEYIKSLKYYGFRICFNSNSINLKEDLVYPNYPWNPKFKNIFIKKKK